MLRLLRPLVSPPVVLLGIVLIIASLTACVSGRVTIAPDPAIDPVRHKTFAWEVDAIRPSGRGDGLYNIDHYLRRQVTRELRERGYREVARSSADFLVGYRLSQRVDVDQGGIISPTDATMASRDASIDPDNTRIYHHYVPVQVRHGILELTLYSSGDNRILWRATLNKIIETGAENSAAVKKVMEQQVPRLFSGFPARSQGL